jgi:hypothetical protein
MGTRLANTFRCLIFLLCNCSANIDKPKSPPNFKSFEISYTNGWTKGFSLLVDSNKIYFSQQKSDTIYFGILPDTIFKVIDGLVLIIVNDRTLKSKNRGCEDCSVVAIQALIKTDTIRINQSGDVDEVFWPVINIIQTFIDKGKHQKIRSLFFFETTSSVNPSPPIVDGNFLPPKTNKK